MLQSHTAYRKNNNGDILHAQLLLVCVIAGVRTKLAHDRTASLFAGPEYRQPRHISVS